MRETEVGAPVASSDGDDAQLGDDDGGTDGSGDFLGGLDSETDVALRVTDDDNGLESGALTGTGLLLDGLDLYFAKSKKGLLAQTVSLCPRLKLFMLEISALFSPICCFQSVNGDPKGRKWQSITKTNTQRQSAPS